MNIPRGARGRARGSGGARGTRDHGDGAGATTSSARGTGQDTTATSSRGGHARSSNRDHHGRLAGGGNAGGHGNDLSAAGGNLDLDRDDGVAGGLLRDSRSAAGRGRSRSRSLGAAGRNLNRGHGAGRGSGHGGGRGRGDSLNRLRSRGLTARAVGDGRTARRDGHVLSRVDGLHVTLGDGSGHTGEESNGSSGQTHFD